MNTMRWALIGSWLFFGCSDADPDADPIQVPPADAEPMTADGGIMLDATDGNATDSATSIEDAAPGEDAAPSEDAAPNADGAIDPDAAPPLDMPPTWVDCQLAHRGEGLSEAMAAQCDALHTEPPEDRLYGIRFVMMDDVGDVMDFIAPRIEAANQIFAPAGIQFTVGDIVNIDEDEVQYLTGDQALSLSARQGGLRSHLQMPDAELDTLLDTLRSRLTTSGADPETIAALDGDSVFTDQLFMRLMARVHPEQIYLAVGTVSERMGAGGQAPPPFHPIRTLERSVVSIRPGTKTTVPAHELGHYFGLKHPHTGSARGPNAHRFDVNRTETVYRTRAGEEYEVVDVVETHFGEAFEEPLGAPFVAYDVDDDAIADFEALRFAVMDTWARWRMAYGPERTPFATFAEFMAAWQNRDAIGMSNYMRRENNQQINNCRWQMTDRVFACTYPDTESPVAADAPILDGYILFEEGAQANVMSYIRIPARNAPPTNYGLFQEQIDVMHISANAPQRLSLRNYAQ